MQFSKPCEVGDQQPEGVGNLDAVCAPETQAPYLSGQPIS